MQDTIKTQVRLPASVYNRLKKEQKLRPHLSMNSIMVEAIISELSKNEAIRSNKTQIDLSALEGGRA
jgi:hypothetical protein